MKFDPPSTPGIPVPTTVETVFTTEWFSIRRETFSDAAFAGAPYYTLDSGDGCFIIPMTEKGELILIRQFRPSLSAFTVEMPAGAVDRGEAPESAAKRELFEETGYLAESMALVGSGHMMMNRFSGTMYGYVARNCRLSPTARTEPGIEVILASWEEFNASVLEDRFAQLGGLAFLHLAKMKQLL